MSKLGRRLVLRGSVGLAAAGTFASPYIARAQAKTASVLWVQGFVKEEDEAFKNLVAAYEKASGNKIDFSLIPFGPAMQKIVAGLTSGDTPDIMYHAIADQTVVPQNTWNDKLVDVSDVVDTQKAHFHPTALLTSQYYNNVTKQRGYTYVPIKCGVSPFHVWNSLVEKAGFKLSDAPKTWDAFWDFFKPMQKKLRETQRNIYVHGLQPTTNGPADGNTLFHHFLIANGGDDIVTPDGRAHLDDPKVKEAVIKSLTYITTSYKEGYVPPGALGWSDADDNNAFHAKQILMHLDGGRDVPREGQVQRRHHARSRQRQRRQADAGYTRCARCLRRQEREERRGRQGLSEVRNPARCAEYQPEDRAGPLLAADAASREGGSVLAQGGPTRRGLRHRRHDRPDRAQLSVLQPGLRRGQRPAGLGHRGG